MYIDMMETVFTGSAPYNPTDLDNFLKQYYGDRRLAEESKYPRAMVLAVEVRQKNTCTGHMKIFGNYALISDGKSDMIDHAAALPPTSELCEYSEFLLLFRVYVN